jgi:predicted SprT family Zn-dependent metalloprotease
MPVDEQLAVRRVDGDRPDGLVLRCDCGRDAFRVARIPLESGRTWVYVCASCGRGFKVDTITPED